MPITITQTRLGDYTWRFDVAGAAYYYWRVDGRRYFEGPDASLVISGGHQVWVSDVGYGDDGDFHPGYAVLQANIDNSAEDHDYLQWQEYSGGEWVTRRETPVDKSGTYSYRTDWLADVTTHQFRCRPVGKNGNNGTAVEFSIFMVRNPDPPDLAFSYSDDTNEVTIAAA